MTFTLIAIVWFVLPPLSIIAVAMLWFRSRLWGLLPILVALVLVAGFFLKMNFEGSIASVDPAEEQRRIQSKVYFQLVVSLLFAIGFTGIIWQCVCNRKKP
jgi:uncharacterized membrane protein